jgi:valyl-tRNA synthetase
MDTWMTSSLTPLIVADWAEGDSFDRIVYPMSLRPQAFEIIRTWLFYTVVKSEFHTRSLPWESVMISGWGLDIHGKKMSKSAGNFVSLEDIVDRYSADGLRCWAAKGALGQDLRYNEEDVVTGKKLQIKLWNAARFLSQNLGSIEPDAAVAMTTPDTWIVSRLQKTVEQATRWFDEYEYSQALRATEKFFWNDYCDNYLEIIKDRLWNPEQYTAGNVAAARMTMYNVFFDVVKLFAPFIPYITEEIYDCLYKASHGARSIHLVSWPDMDAARIDEKAELRTELLVSILKGVRKRKTELQIHQNHRISKVVIRCPDAVRDEIAHVAADLKSAARADEITFGEEADRETDHPDIKIELV